MGSNKNLNVKCDAGFTICFKRNSSNVIKNSARGNERFTSKDKTEETMHLLLQCAEGTTHIMGNKLFIRNQFV